MAKFYLCWDILNLCFLNFSRFNFVFRIQECLNLFEYLIYIGNVFLKIDLLKMFQHS